MRGVGPEHACRDNDSGTRKGTSGNARPATAQWRISKLSVNRANVAVGRPFTADPLRTYPPQDGQPGMADLPWCVFDTARNACRQRSVGLLLFLFFFFFRVAPLL